MTVSSPIIYCIFCLFLFANNSTSLNLIQSKYKKNICLKYKAFASPLQITNGEKSFTLNAYNSDNLESKKEDKQRILRNFVTPFAISSVLSVAAMLLFKQPAYADGYFDAIQKSASESGLIQSYLLIFISELGDKTFFIAALLAAKYGRFISFTGSIAALAVMTIISTVLGQLFHAVPASITQGIPFDDYIAVAAFSYFGIKTLIDASKLADGDSSGIEEEKAEAEEIVEELTVDQKRSSIIALIIQTFSLVFAAEIGDRSFLSTIALSAALNPYAVATGAIAAHASATGLAVLGGAFMSKYFSEKVIGYIGGTLFITFAITTALGIF